MKIIRKLSRIFFLGFLILIAGLSIAAPWVTKYSYEEQNLSQKLEGPSLNHWMGTDTLGRDQYSRIVYGGRLSLAIGLLSAVSSLILGVLVGVLAGYVGGWVDRILMHLVDILMIFPNVLMAILLMLFLGRGFLGIFIAIAVTSWLNLARIVRGQVLQAKFLPYVESAKALGVSRFGIVFRHILPNLAGSIVVSLAIQVPNNIMAESFLSFIGLGLQPPYSSWGTLANEGFRGMQSYPHLIIFPGLVLFMTILALNHIADGLKYAFVSKISQNESL